MLDIRKMVLQILGIVFVSFLFLLLIMKILDLSAEAGNQAITELGEVTVLENQDTFLVVEDDATDTKNKQLTWSNLQTNIVKTGIITSGVWNAGAVTSSGTITSSGTFDVTGATGMVLGSSDVTSLTVTTDGTGTGEVVLPAGSVSGTEITDSTVVAADHADYDWGEFNLVAHSAILDDNVTTTGWNLGVFTGTSCDISDTVQAQNFKIDGTAGLGYMDFLGQSANSVSPSAGTIRLHSATENGFTRLEQDNEAATNIIYGRDSVVICKNNSGGSITKGQVVYVNGTASGVPTIAKARANAGTTIPALGFLMDTTADGSFGQVMKIGILSGIDTSTFSEGNALWVSTATAGAWQNTRPSGANYVQKLGTVLSQNATTGTILVTVAPFVGNMETGTNATHWSGTNVYVAAEAYNATGWDSDTSVATKNDIRDKIEAITAGGGDAITVDGVAVTDPDFGDTGTVNVSQSGNKIQWNIEDSVTLVTPNIGAATATSVNGLKPVTPGSNPTVTTQYNLSIDTTDSQLLYNSSGSANPVVLNGRRPYSFTIPAPVASEKIILWGKLPYAITIKSISGIVDPADTNDTCVFVLYESDANGDFTDSATNGLDGTTSIQAINTSWTNDDGTLSNPTIASGASIGYRPTSVSGTVSMLTISGYYTIDRQ